MTAKDYQHHRFRAPGTSETSEFSPDHPAPRLVTPNNVSSSRTMENESDSIGDGFVPRKIEIEKTEEIASSTTTPPVVVEPDYVHKPTQNGTQSVHSPLKPSGPQRYSLSKGTGTDLKYDDEGLSKKFKEAHSMALLKSKETSKTREKKKSSRRKHDPSSYKIFLLLLQPESKIFELIQLIYLPNDTTVGNIISMIPENATEQALGNQEYIGLCRPKTQEEIVDKELLASETSSGVEVESAKITLGEILVAIPMGHTGPDVAALSKQILSNPKIVKLLKRADPLAPKKRRSRKGRSHRSTTRSTSREKVHVLEKHDEAEEIKLEESEQMMNKAMEHAAAEAAAANAQVSAGDDDSFVPKITRQDSIGSDGQSLGSSLQESVDESYSSWSKSFDASFSVQSSICSGISRRAVRRRDRQAKRTRIIKRSGVVAFGAMVVLYMMDPRGYSGNHVQELTEAPMGFTGLFQVLFLLVALFKIERFIRSTTEENYSSESKCPFLKAADTAMQQFKGKYAKKLKKSRSARDDDSLLSNRQQSYSLKAAAFQDLDDGDASGSL
jgi:hypothetical protein